ncbi:glycogen debranching N-terminal domain-containing protein [Dactylosporangium sp. NPDC051541]|uniref:glycogen debranching N-terminal domain-containing protein n=1 Tax=Dactylosporangium sp. NPDC051541 TaxID=3363977 RepID=UPI0037AB51D1
MPTDPITCLAAPAAWLSDSLRDDSLRDDALHDDALFVDGARILSGWQLLVDGAAPTPASSHRTGASSASFTAACANPSLTITRRRVAEPMGGTEIITLANASDASITVTVSVLTEPSTSARIEATPPPSSTSARIEATRPPSSAPARMEATPPPSSARMEAAPLSASARFEAASPGPAAPLTWTAAVPPRGTWSAEVRITRTDIPSIARPKRFSTLRVTADDARLNALVRAGVQDLDALRRTRGPDAYYSTSSPTHLTLSPREALWAARLALPLGHDVAAGTLRLVADLLDAALAPLYAATLAEAIRWGMSPDAAPPVSLDLSAFGPPGLRLRAPGVITDLLDAAERHDYRLPPPADLDPSISSSDRPHACGAATAPAVLTALLGLDVDVPKGQITFDPLTPSPVGAFRIRGLKIADGLLDASVTSEGTLTVHNGPLGVTFHNADGSPARIA